ncbi:putative entry exclusion protein TrbK-alt [Sphingomonas trueperi]|uniref:Conjugative transfer region protein TrbK n=1 Tax=Sphingomonas trueperi TaxID=53317 RepID=A0A7X6BCF2_9SPHN|nr:putative entry exclusion protein TrbK-alt [Sphingomonas trueperi]NJB97155.1 conjugative transfer region protein TrbK [Sphingomonas trueperi]
MPSRNLKIAGVAALAGMMMAVVIVGTTKRDQPAPADMNAPPVAAASDPLARELDRCATLTMPDAGCEAAWAANRRRFFGQNDPSAETVGTADQVAAQGQGEPQDAAALPIKTGARP